MECLNFEYAEKIRDIQLRFENNKLISAWIPIPTEQMDEVVVSFHEEYGPPSFKSDFKSIYRQLKVIIQRKPSGVLFASDDYFVSLIERWSEEGDQKAKTCLGMMYSEGLVLPKNHEKALDLFLDAAKYGEPKAQFRIGEAYQAGLGVIQDSSAAVGWYRKSAEQGYVKAQRALGEAYKRGDGIEEDKDQADSWLYKAAVQGDRSAKESLGVKWYGPAAERGDYEAQFHLGELYLKGWEVPRDPVIAYALVDMAVDASQWPDRTRMAEERKIRRRQLTDQQLAKAALLRNELEKPGNFATAIEGHLAARGIEPPYTSSTPFKSIDEYYQRIGNDPAYAIAVLKKQAEDNPQVVRRLKAIEMAMVPFGFHGRIVDTEGSGLSKAVVHYKLGYPYGIGYTAEMTVETDSNGHFVVRSRANSLLIKEIRKPEYRIQEGQARAFEFRQRADEQAGSWMDYTEDNPYVFVMAPVPSQ